MEKQKFAFQLGTFRDEAGVKNRIFIEWRIEYIDAEAITINDEKVDGYYTLGIMGLIKRGRVFVASGQIQDEIWEVKRRDKLELSIDEADFYRLMECWERFHLNNFVNDWDRWLLLPLPNFVFKVGERLKKYSL